MALEMRGTCGPYYTRSVRRNGRVVREYLGNGPAAVVIAQLEQFDRELRSCERREADREETAKALAEGALDEFCAAVDAHIRHTLQAAGYRQHHRGEWRRKREHKTG